MKKITIGKHIVPFWLVLVLLISVFGSVLGYAVWTTLNIPFEVKEPIEVLNYPSQLSLYPGETSNFNITVENHASINYSVSLDFHLSNTTYQTNYTTFSTYIYTVIPGQQSLTAWVNVTSDAPAVVAQLTIDLSRGAYPSGLVGYWKLDEGSGTTTSDSSGNGNTGILMNGPQWVNGKYGKALDFNGVNNFVSIPDSPSLRVQSFSLAAWIYMTERPYQHGSRHSAIINKMYFQISGTGTHGYKLQFDDPSSTNDNLVITIGDENAQRYLVTYNSIDDLTLNQWHQVVGTWDGSRSSIYIDGQLKNSSSTEAYTIVHDDTTLALGTETTSGAKDVWFNGIIDEAMVFNRGLSAEEVMATYSSPLP